MFCSLFMYFGFNFFCTVQKMPVREIKTPTQVEQRLDERPPHKRGYIRCDQVPPKMTLPCVGG